MENKVLARVEENEITQQDVQLFLQEIGPQVAMQFQSPEGMEKVLEELVNQELLYLEAKKNKVDETDEFKEIIEQTTKNILKSYSLTKLIEDETVNEDEMKKFYEDNKEQFKKDESAIASHILVDSEEEAENIAKEIEEGLSFADAAAKYSSCPSKEQGGRLQEFNRGQMVPEFEEVAFEMEAGEISEPVKSQFGYHLIEMIEVKPAGQSEYEEVKDQIQEHVLRQKQQDKYLNKIDELKKEYTIEIVK